MGNPVAGAVRSELRIARPLSTGKPAPTCSLCLGSSMLVPAPFTIHVPFSPPSAKSTRFFLCNWPVHLTFGLMEPAVTRIGRNTPSRFLCAASINCRAWGGCRLKPQFPSQMLPPIAAPRAFRCFCSANGRFQEAAPSLFLTTQKAAERFLALRVCARERKRKAKPGKPRTAAKPLV